MQTGLRDVFGNAAGSRIVRFIAPVMMVLGSFITASVSAYAAIPAQERSALQDLYNNVNGVSWRSSSNWTETGSECTWFGVTCDSGQTTVTGLSLSANQLSGSIPSSLGNLTNLQVLDLSFNQLTGTIPSTLSTLTNLHQLNLSHNQLSGSLPSFFSSRGNLQVLDLSANQFTGSIPVTLIMLSNLQRLALSANKLGGTIPPELGSLTSLQLVNLASNQLSGAIPPELGNLTNLQQMNLSGNVLSGSIPSSLGSLAKLEGLYLSSNFLSGTIPVELGNMKSLQQLILNANQLSGSIPSSLSNLTNLLNLNLSSNQLSGTIPSFLGGLPDLLVLVLSGNQLSGSIPAALGNATSMVVLDLSANSLSGAMPSSLTRLSSLGGIGIGYNALYTNDAVLSAFLDFMQPGWEYTETVPPTNVNAETQPDLSVLVSWLPINYMADSGRYQVWASTISGGPYTLSGLTFTKSSSSLSLRGLAAGTYYFVVETTTDANAHNRNAVSSNFSPEISITIGPRSVSNLALSAGGATATSTLGSGLTTQAGYAAITVNSGPAPYGTAVFSYTQNGTIVSEAGVPASAPTTSALIFIDYRTGAAIPGSNGTVDISTGFAVVNAGSGTATITATLRSLDGTVVTTGAGTIAKGGHIAKYINQLGGILSGFSIPPSFPVSTRFGTLELTSNQPLSIVALRLTTNQRGDTLLTSTPIADKTAQLASAPIYFPQLVDGGGYTTTVMLMNTSTAVESGTMVLYANDGSPLTVKQVGGASGSSFTYSIAPGAAYLFQTDASAAAESAGWVQVTPDGGSSTPAGGGIFQYSRSGMLVTESGIPSTVPTTHARIFVDTSKGHDTGLALGNPGNGSVNVTLTGFLPDGITQIGASQGPITLAGNGHFAAFVDQQIAGLPPDFQGVLDIAGDSPFTTLTLRSLMNGRGDFLLTTFPVADVNKPAPSPAFIPQYADGGGFTTEFILLSAGPSSVAAISFFGDSGAPVTLVLSR
jgi:Leucine-rich repeat (LRR) protein